MDEFNFEKYSMIFEESRPALKKILSSLETNMKDYFLMNYGSVPVIKQKLLTAKEYAEMYKNHGEKYEDLGYIENNFTLSGLIAYAEKNYEMAISDLKQSNLNNPFNKYHIALAYIKNGEKTKAIDNLESAVNYTANVSLTNESVRVRTAKQLALLKADD